MNKKLEMIASYPNGTTLVVVRNGLYKHYGIFFDGKVIHNTIEGEVVEVSLSEFAKGGKIRICHEITSETPQFAGEKAKSLIGSPYNFLFYNCEHFVNDVHGMGKNSVQIEQLFAGGLIYILSKNASPGLRILGCAAVCLCIDSKDPIGGAVRGAMGATLVLAIPRLLQHLK